MGSRQEVCRPRTAAPGWRLRGSSGDGGKAAASCRRRSALGVADHGSRSQRAGRHRAGEGTWTCGRGCPPAPRPAAAAGAGCAHPPAGSPGRRGAGRASRPGARGSGDPPRVLIAYRGIVAAGSSGTGSSGPDRPRRGPRDPLARDRRAPTVRPPPIPPQPLLRSGPSRLAPPAGPAPSRDRPEVLDRREVLDRHRPPPT